MKTITMASTQLWAKEFVNDPPLLLLTVNAPNTFDLPGTRFIPAHEDIVSRGETYQSFALELLLPADNERTLSRTRITLANASKVLQEDILEGRFINGTVKIEIIRRNAPDIVEFSIELAIDQIQTDNNRIEIQLSKSNLLEASAVRTYFTPKVSPGLFE